MITIVEGPDCTGKSTLIANAFSSSRYKYHFGPPPPGPDSAFEQYLNALEEARKTIDEWDEDDLPPDMNPHCHLVYDRFVYGELIYPKIMNRVSNFDTIQMRMLERVLLSHRSVLVLCLTNIETAVELWRERKGAEMIGKEDKFRESYKAWEMLSQKGIPSLPTVYYDLEKTGYAAISQIADSTRSPVNGGPGIGMYREGSIVLVGEQVNPKIDTLGWPFVEEGKTGSSYWFTRMLDELGYSEDQLYWINALRRDGTETRPEFLETMKPSKVVTLGKTAELWARRNNVTQYAPVRPIPHPQFWKRFQAGKDYLLDEAMKG